MPQLPILQPLRTNSPKRKRITYPFEPRIDTTPRHSPRTANLSGASSPRSVVADQLEGLDLRGSVPPLDFGADAGITTPKATKRARRADSDGRGMTIEGFEDVQSTAPDVKWGASPPETPTSQPSPPRLLEVQETPQPALFQQGPAACSPPVSPLMKAACQTPPPAPLPASDAVNANSTTGDTPSPRSLTWQEEEITGHLVNPADDPDDDGYGINGIGFKPTPMMAYARSQRRKQQLLEWRAREAREARAKRSHRRLRGVSSVSDSDSRQSGKNRRVVRFA